MNHQQQFERFLRDIDSELQARTGNPHLTHQDFEQFDFSFEFEIGATVAETVAELLIQLQTTSRNLTSLR